MPPSELWEGLNKLTDLDLVSSRLFAGLDQCERMERVYRTTVEHFDLFLSPDSGDTARWVWYSLVGRLEKYLKWSTADLLARFLLQEELPPRPTDFAVTACGPFGGKFGNYLRRTLTKLNRTGYDEWWANFAFSIYQAKAASLPVTEEFVEGALTDAVHRLTDPSYQPGSFAKELLISEIDDVVEEVFPKCKRQRLEGLIPSMRSSWQSSRNKGGAMGYIINGNPTSALYIPCLVGYLRGYGLGGAVVPFYGPPPELFEDRVEDTYRMATTKTVCNAVYVGLLEPFKVRVITRGDADIYHLGRQWQKRVHPIMSRHPVFNLTRSPITQEHLDWFTDQIPDEFWGSEGFIVSGDYESATDLLDPELSNYTLRLVSDRLGVPLEDTLALERSLTGHTLYRKLTEEGRMQTRGQLMGSPASFPILCLINAAATRLAIRLRTLIREAEMEDSEDPCAWAVEFATETEILSSPHHQVPLSSLPLLINGDDVGFISDSLGYDVWKRVTMAAGLKFSLGKNYTSPNFLILNSQLFTINPGYSKEALNIGWLWGQEDSCRSRLSRTRHLEVGLLYGTVKGKSRAEQEESLFTESPFLDQALSFSRMAQQLIEPWSARQQDLLMTEFLRLHGELFRSSVPTGMSWFLPRHLGGLGLPVTREVTVTEQQLRVAAYLTTRPADDPEVLHLVCPDLPSYLDSYLGHLGRSSDAIFAPRSRYRCVSDISCLQELKQEQKMKGLAPFTLLGLDSQQTAQDIVKKVWHAWRSLWRKATRCSLQPMSKVKALSHQSLYIRTAATWC
jgi:hypothetical protein